jgi:hypothetical protein
MRILFCSDPFSPKKVDYDYEKEFEQAVKLGIKVELFSFDELVNNQNASKSINRIVEAEDEELVIYRGWMLKPNDYKTLYDALADKNLFLINSRKEYQHCHYLPESYSVIKSQTPLTQWITKKDLEQSFENVYEAVQVFANSPIIIKDYVKSRKYDWEEACFIPDASDKERVKKVVQRFLELQGDELNEGIVFRQFVNLEFLSQHSKSQLPLSKEFRIFFLNHKPISIFHYWDEGEYGDTSPDLQPFLDIAKQVKSNFFTMDIAKLEDGDWTIIELGDGQVSGLPDNANLEQFYNNFLSL